MFAEVPLIVPLSSSVVSDGGQALCGTDFNDDRTIAPAWYCSCIARSEQEIHLTFRVAGFGRIAMSCSVGIAHTDTLVTWRQPLKIQQCKCLAFIHGCLNAAHQRY